MKNLDKDDCDGLIIFHHEWSSAQNVAKSFRASYPKSKLFLSRDHLPMVKSERFKEFDITVTPTFSTTQFFFNLNFNDYKLSDVTEKDFFLKIEQDLARMEFALSNSENPFLIYMEADSLVQFRLNTDYLTDMDSLDINLYPKEILGLINEMAPDRQFGIQGWGFVTGAIRVTAGKQMLSWYLQNKHILARLFREDPRMLYLDYFAPILMHLSGGAVTNSNQVGECLRIKKRERKRFALLHQYREHY